MPADELEISSPLVLELLNLLPPSKYIVATPDSIICKSIVSLRAFVQPLGQPSRLPLSQPFVFVQHLLLQLQFLEKRHKQGVLYFSLDHIVVLNGDTYLLHNLEALAPLKAPLYKSFIMSYPLDDGRTSGDTDNGIYRSPLLFCSPLILPFTVPLCVTANSFGQLCEAIVDPKDRKKGSRLYHFIVRSYGEDGTLLFL